jgi:hypothetical protein
MSEHRTPVTEWDEEEQAEETSDPTSPRFLAHWAVHFLPLPAMEALGIWFYRHH